MDALEVISSGPLLLIQDLGRTGVGHLGFSQGGPVDLHAFCWANRLLGNAPNAAILEITMGQVAFKACCDVMLALTGANMPATIDGVSIGHWQSFLIKKGQTLRLGYAREGLRAYLAIASGIIAPKIYGSCATVIRNHIGGLADAQGQALKKGSIIAMHKPYVYTHQPKWVPFRFRPNYSEELDIGIFETYQHNLFSPEQKSLFYSTSYTVSDKLDRMGVRLEGDAIHPICDGIISEGVAPGSIQFPSNGQPIILSVDRQTLGGYPKIGCVSKIGLMRLSQARPGSKLHFYQADVAEESEKYSQFVQFFNI